MNFLNSKSNDNDAYMVDALAHGLSVLRIFEYSRDGLSLSEVASRLGWSRTKPYRYLHTLERLGYLRRDAATKRYRPTSLTMMLGYTYLNGLILTEIAQPVMNQLCDEAGATVHLGILEEHDVVYIASARLPSMPTINIHVGSRIAPYATSIGRVLLAQLDPLALDKLIGNDPLPAFTPYSTTDPAAFRELLKQTRTQGYAITDEEFHPGVRSVAAPIRSSDGSIAAAINATAVLHKFTDGFIENTVIPRVLDAAAEISMGLGYIETKHGQP